MRIMQINVEALVKKWIEGNFFYNKVYLNFKKISCNNCNINRSKNFNLNYEGYSINKENFFWKNQNDFFSINLYTALFGVGL